MKEKNQKERDWMEQGGSQNLIKAGPDLRLVPFRSRGIHLAEGNRGPGLYSRKYSICCG